MPSDSFYLLAFAKLGTCRHIGNSVGPIPYNLIVWYAERKGLDQQSQILFEAVMTSMDVAFLDWSAKEAEKQSKKGSKPLGNVEREKK